MEKEESTVMSFLNSTIGKVITIILGLYVVTSILPELLSAKNDFAVTIGVVFIISLIVCVIKFNVKIIEWLKS